MTILYWGATPFNHLSWKITVISMEKLQLGLFDRSDILRGSFSPTSHCNLKCFGYTLIELVMTIVIMSILMIVSVPIFFSTTTYQRQVYYDELLNGIRYARILAIGTGNHIQVSLTGNSITLQQRIEGSGCTAGTTFQPILDPGTRATGFVKNAPGTVTINFSANWPLYFNGLGQALSSSNCAVIGTATVGVVGGNTMTVFGQTGFVQ